jgi:hypothetical protein
MAEDQQESFDAVGETANRQPPLPDASTRSELEQEDGQQGREEPAHEQDPAGAPAAISASPLQEDPTDYLPFGKTSDPEGKPERPLLPPPTRESLIPIHDFVRLYPREWAVVNHPAFQRLGSILQLGQTFLVFRGATHCRFEHALGTLHVAQLIINSLDRSSAAEDLIPESNGAWRLDEPLSGSERRFIRLAALLHDLGHLPAGHTLEDELGLLDHHDADQRLNLILDRVNWHGLEPEETLRQLIDRMYGDAAAETGLKVPATEIVLELISRDRKDSSPSTGGFRLNVGRDIIGNTICAIAIGSIWERLDISIIALSSRVVSTAAAITRTSDIQPGRRR